MSYSASVLKVMIASPGDVEKERRISREVIQEWNFIHSEDKSIVLMPISWETHSSPSMEGRAQEIINKQILEDCDLLVAIFWTRVGTPTGKSESGTVEEINEHISAGKPAMIYFSSVPVVPESVDVEQYSKLSEFREDLKKQGLVEGYESLSEFREKFSRQLAQTVLRQFVDESEFFTPESEIIYTNRHISLSDDASDLLMTTVQEGSGSILSLRTMGGVSIQAGNKQFVDSGNPRSEARWIKALEELVQLDYIRDRGFKGEIFEVTADGYGAADELLLQS